MVGSRGLQGILLVFATVLGGCVADSGSSALGTGPAFTDDTGSIQGSVVDEQLAPVPDVVVSLDGTENQTTAADGSFHFPYVTPGTHVIHALRPSFTTASREVSVEAGAATNVVLNLQVLPSDAPYFETIQQEGLLGCSATIEGTFVYYANCEALYIAGQHDLDRHILRFNIGFLEGITGWFAETTWQPSQTLARALWISWGTSSGSQPDQNLYFVYPFHDTVGPSPHRQRFETADLLKHLETQPSDLCALDTECNLFAVNYSGHDTFTLLPAGIGVQVQQRFEQYLTTFHNGELPQEFTILPDA